MKKCVCVGEYQMKKKRREELILKTYPKMENSHPFYLVQLTVGSFFKELQIKNGYVIIEFLALSLSLILQNPQS